MLSRIFRIPDSKSAFHDNEGKEDPLGRFLDRGNSLGGSKMLICGPSLSGKTSLLFCLALSFAEEDNNVLFVCPRKLSKLPLLPEGEKHPSSSILKRIHMVYLEKREEFLKYMASVHLTWDKLYQCVIVDDLDSYACGVSKNEDLALMARLLAFTVDAFTFQMDKQQESGGSQAGFLLISVTIPTTGSVIPRRHLYERWIEYILSIKATKDSEPGGRQFELSILLPQHSEESSSLIDVRYTLTDTHVSVSEVSTYASQSDI